MWENRNNPRAQEYPADKRSMKVEELSSITLVLGHCDLLARSGDHEEQARNFEANNPDALQYSKNYKHEHLTHLVCLGDSEPMPQVLVAGFAEQDCEIKNFKPFLQYTFYYASQASLEVRDLLHDAQMHQMERDLARSSLEPTAASTSSSSKRQTRSGNSEEDRRAGKRRRQDPIANVRAHGTPELPPHSRTTRKSKTAILHRQPSAVPVRTPRVARGPHPSNLDVLARSAPDTRQMRGPLGTAQHPASSNNPVKPPLIPPQRFAPVASTSAAAAGPSSSHTAAGPSRRDEIPSTSRSVRLAPPPPDVPHTPVASTSSVPRESPAPAERNDTDDQANQVDVKPRTVIDISDGEGSDDDGEAPTHPYSQKRLRLILAYLSPTPAADSTVQQLLDYAYDGDPIDAAVYAVFEKGGYGREKLIKKVRQALKRCDFSVRRAWFAKLEGVMPELMFGAVKKQLAV